MGLFGGKKPDNKGPAGKEKPTTARRSRRIVQPGAAKSGTAGPGQTRARSPEPQVRRQPAAAPRPASAEEDAVLQLDDFADAPAPAPSSPMSHVPDLDFQGDLDGGGDQSGPSRSGDAALIEFLVDKVALISAEQAQSAQQLAQDQGLALDVALVRQGSISEDGLVSSLAQECWVPHLKVDKYEIRKKALNTISVEDARRYGVLPVDKLGSILNLAMVNPLDTEAIRQLESKTNLEIKKVVASRSEIEGCLVKYFGGGGDAPLSQDTAPEGSRMFSQDTATATAPPQAKPAPAPAPAPVSAPAPGDDFLDIADIDDLLGEGDEVPPALIEPVALEPLDIQEVLEPQEQAAAPAFVEEDPFAAAVSEQEPTPQPIEEDPFAAAVSDQQLDEPSFAESFEPTAAEPKPDLITEPALPEVPSADQRAATEADRSVTAAEDEILDLEFAPEPASFDDVSPPAATPPPPPAPAARPAQPSASSLAASSRPATRTFTATPSAGPTAAPQVHQIEDLIPVTEEEFQFSISHGRVRVFEKWVGIHTRNRVLNAIPVDAELDPLLEGLKESAYLVEV